MRYLLDKVTVRYCLLGLIKVDKDQHLLNDELLTLDLIFDSEAKQNQFFISPNTANILTQFAQSHLYELAVHTFLQRVSVVSPARYFKRWSRRLREQGFTREDAAILALATFASWDSVFTSVNYVATFDQRMINNWLNQQTVIQARFQAMHTDLTAPYTIAKLPQVVHLDHIEV